ncbi:hypothetical protein [Actinomadura sp. CNU-125]|uniref:hypothetical protein n=1 Tax=Actinomadura sp. CNU-125 TaxID=1904961 RepID=UPI000AAA7B08|nr:hypothetical protein [Actinomadura sp. CNU-125]
MRRSNRARISLAAALVVVCATSACSALDDPDATGATGRGTAQGAVGGRAPSAERGDPVAKQTFTSPLAKGATVDIAIMGLSVSGKLAVLDLQYTPHVTGGSGSSSLAQLHGIEPPVALIDSVNLKRYVVVRDSSDSALQSDLVYGSTHNEQPAALQFTFAAPPEKSGKSTCRSARGPRSAASPSSGDDHAATGRSHRARARARRTVRPAHRLRRRRNPGHRPRRRAAGGAEALRGAAGQGGVVGARGRPLPHRDEGRPALSRPFGAALLPVQSR